MLKKTCILFLCMMSCLFINTTVFALAPSTTSIYNGIDVSNWQGEINFDAVKKAGIDIVYIKSSQGTTEIDPYFESNYQLASEANMKIGVYHYVMAQTIDEAKAEAAFFVSTIAGKNIDCRLAMDYETFGTLSNEQINAIALAFLQEVEQLSGKELVVYSDASNANSLWNAAIANYPLWVADYQLPEATTIVSPPVGSNGINEPNVYALWTSWVGYQYSSIGTVNGINDDSVDLDYFTSEIFLSTSGSIPDSKTQTTPTSVIYYTVQSGDTLSEIASTYDVSVSELVNWNQISNPNLIYVSEVLRIYASSDSQSNSNSNSQTNPTTYVVQAGDTLSEIAQQYKVSVSQLVNWNHISNPNLIYVFEVLTINSSSSNTSTPPHSTNAQTYIVQAGDTLSEIAQQYNVSVSQLVNWNQIANPNLIYVNESLLIY